MKRSLLAFGLLMTGLLAFGQNVRFGIMASPQFAFSRSNDQMVSQDGIKLGLQYGLMIDFALDLNQRYAVHTGFYHSLTGARIIQSVDSAGTTVLTKSQHFKYQYINIPLTMRLRTNEIGYITYWGQFGVTPGILVSSRIDQTADPDPNGQFTRENEKLDGAVPINLSLTLGGGIEYSLGGATSLIAGLQYNNGFTNVYDDKDGDKDDKLSFRNVRLRFGFLF